MKGDFIEPAATLDDPMFSLPVWSQQGPSGFQVKEPISAVLSEMQPKSTSEPFMAGGAGEKFQKQQNN